jgi:hypothetical protein
MSKSANVEKSFESKTKGEGSSGLSSNMVGVGKSGHIYGLVIHVPEGPSAYTRLSDHNPPLAPIHMADLNADIFQRLHPKAYLERFLAEQLRPDGREAADWRDLYVHVGSISTADGSALVRLGHTTIVCGVKAEIAEPDLEQPTEGFLVPNIDLPAMCAPRFKPGPPSEEAQVLSDRLASTITAPSPPLSAMHTPRARRVGAIRRCDMY